MKDRESVMNGVAKSISDMIYKKMYNAEHNERYEDEFSLYEFTATKYIEGHVENGGDEYGGFWEEVAVTDSETYDVEIYGPTGSRLYSLEVQVEQMLEYA